MSGGSVVCKYCGSDSVVKFGTYKGTQRYFCKSCQRKFSANDRLFKAKAPLGQVSESLTDYYDGKSIGTICRSIGDADPTKGQPSTKTVYMWIDKYTQEAIDSFRGYKPKVGDTWIADETVLRIDGANVWLYDIIDADTRFMLASRIATARTINDARALMEQAARVAGKNPKAVVTDRNNSYLDGIELAYGSDTEHRLGNPFTLIKDDNTNLIERFHGTLKSRTKTMRGMKSLSTAQQFADGYLTFYNFLRPHESLQHHTPAQVAEIDYPIRTWEAVILNTEPQVEVLTIPAKTIIVSELAPVERPIKHRNYKTGRKRLRRRKPASEASITLVGRKKG